jgi:hypothetical protein
MTKDVSGFAIQSPSKNCGKCEYESGIEMFTTLFCEIDGKRYKVIKLAKSKEEVVTHCLSNEDFSLIITDSDSGVFIVCELEGEEIV